MRNAVFVYGAMRSGTTVFRLMLDNHEALANPGEVDFLFDHIRRGPDGTWRYDRDALRAGRIFQAKELDPPAGLDGEALLGWMIDEMGRRAGSRLLTMNVHRNADRLAELLPQARVIHMLRDPRDVARSSIGMGWAADLFHGVDHWVDSERSWEAAAARLPAENVCELRYERLFQDIEAELRRVCAFLGVDYSRAMLDYHLRSTYGPPDPKLVEQWRRKSTPAEIGLVEGKAGALFERRGYPLSGHPLRRPGRAERLVMSARNRLHRLRVAVDRFGFYNVAMEKLARWLGFTESQRRFRRRMDAVIAARLK